MAETVWKAELAFGALVLALFWVSVFLPDILGFSRCLYDPSRRVLPLSSPTNLEAPSQVLAYKAIGAFYQGLCMAKYLEELISIGQKSGTTTELGH